MYLLPDRRDIQLLFLRLDLLAEFGLLTYFYWLLIQSRMVKAMMVLSTIPFYAFCFISMFLQTDKAVFYPWPLLIEYIYFIVVITIYFFERMKFSLEQPIYHTRYFWISVGVFVYVSGLFFYVLLAEGYRHVNVDNVNEKLRIISFSLVIFRNLIFSYSVTFKVPVQEKEDFNIPLEMNLDSFENFVPKKT